jgi:hypothetical protein
LAIEYFNQRLKHYLNSKISGWMDSVRAGSKATRPRRHTST